MTTVDYEKLYKEANGDKEAYWAAVKQAGGDLLFAGFFWWSQEKDKKNG